MSKDEGQACHLDIISWNKGRTYLYTENKVQKGILPEVFKEIFKTVNCEVDVSHSPPARIKAGASKLFSDLTFFPSPLGSSLDAGDQKYLKIKSEKSPNEEDIILPQSKSNIIPTPFLYPKLAIIGKKGNPINQNTDFSQFRIGSIHAPQKNERLWKDFFGLDNPPIGFKSVTLGLRAVVAGRIDGYIAFASAASNFDTPEKLEVIKVLSPLALRLVVHERGLSKLSEKDIFDIDQRIQQLHKTEEIKDIVTKYVSSDYFYFPNDYVGD